MEICPDAVATPGGLQTASGTYQQTVLLIGLSDDLYLGEGQPVLFKSQLEGRGIDHPVVPDLECVDVMLAGL